MKQLSDPAKSTKGIYWLLLLAALVVALGVYFLPEGRLLDFNMTGKGEKSPVDQEENLVYGTQYVPSSEHIVDRDGIILVNMGNKVLAKQLTTAVEIDAGSILQRSDRPIQRISEYVSYLYMYDGQTVYRTQIGKDSKLHTAVEDCLKFEPMGDYIYSLKEYQGACYLFRCSLIGSYEKRLFGKPVEDFWAYGGNLLTLDSKGCYRWYNVVSQSTLDHILPSGVSDLTLDESGIIYLLNGTLFQRPYSAQYDTVLAEQTVAFAADGQNIVLLKEDGQLYLLDGDSSICLAGRTFSRDVSIDLSDDYAFVTEPDGEIWFTVLNQINWKLVFYD